MEVFHSGSPLVFAMFLVAMSARIPSQVASEAFFSRALWPGDLRLVPGMMFITGPMKKLPLAV